MSLIALFDGRKSHARHVQNPHYPPPPAPATTITHQFQTNQDRQDPYVLPTTKITRQSQTNRGRQDPYDPSREFYLQNPRSLIAPALSFAQEPQSQAQIEYKETPEAHVFRANLHGYKKEEVKVQVENDRVLKITGEKKLVQKQYDNWHHFQRRNGNYSTAFNLPEDARADKVKSSMENGLLVITVPKKGAKKSRTFFFI
ncbi:18.1 kDa class I heat shock protein-like [Lycium ferocissimum]|uniref:18.1 kDa class I heat shock protein-like n=1 Tax=Lycium ferocissimum TaxID=112874 RepID=UPI0028161765|nr:18.1 kDa class I heat shock protein-like [Lycium ferocissimum]